MNHTMEENPPPPAPALTRVTPDKDLVRLMDTQEEEVYEKGSGDRRGGREGSEDGGGDGRGVPVAEGGEEEQENAQEVSTTKETDSNVKEGGAGEVPSAEDGEEEQVNGDAQEVSPSTETDSNVKEGGGVPVAEGGKEEQVNRDAQEVSTTKETDSDVEEGGGEVPLAEDGEEEQLNGDAQEVSTTKETDSDVEEGGGEVPLAEDGEEEQVNGDAQEVSSSTEADSDVEEGGGGVPLTEDGEEEQMNGDAQEVSSSMPNDSAMERGRAPTYDARSEATFQFHVKEFSKMNRALWSLPCSVRSLPWRIRVLPCITTGQDGSNWWSFGFFLHCSPQFQSTSWCCNAVADLRLLSVKEGQEPFTRKINNLFCSKQAGSGFYNFMAWNDVLDPEKGYIKDDAITVEVWVAADTPYGVSWDSKRHTGSVGPNNLATTSHMNGDTQEVLSTTANDREVGEDDTRPEATFQFHVKKFSKLKNVLLSPPCSVRSLPWKIMVMPRTRQEPDGSRYRCLGFFLQCNGQSRSNSWFCNAVAELRLLSVKEGQEPFTRKIQHVFFSKENDWGFSNFMAWNDVLDPEEGYIKDDAITLEVWVAADSPREVSWLRTGSAGLDNRAATSHMNFLLQTENRKLRTENEEVKVKCRELREENEELHIRLQELEKENEKMKNKLDIEGAVLTMKKDIIAETTKAIMEEINEREEIQKRANNIIIYNLAEPRSTVEEEQRQEDVERCSHVLKDVLKADVGMTEVVRLGKQDQNNCRPRPTLIKLESEAEKWLVLSKAENLRSAEEDMRKLVVAPDMTKKQRKTKTKN